MTVIGISMVKNEIDVIEGTIRHMADEVDSLIVFDNMSTDGTRETLESLAEDLPLTILDDNDPAHYQSIKMSALATYAADNGAEWIVPFDADELWYSHGGRIKDVLQELGNGYVDATLYNHFSTSVDEPCEDPFKRMVWRKREPGAMGKVAFRFEPGSVIRDGNHSVSLPSGAARISAPLAIRHFPYRSAEQMVRKALQGEAALALTDLSQDIGAHWRGYARIHRTMGEQALMDVYREHFWFSAPWESDMILDPAPYLRWKP